MADVTYHGTPLHLKGTGYHDHNWGNISMLKLMHHWYWGRAKVGDNSNHTLKFLPTDEYIDEHTGKPVYGKVIYEYTTESDISSQCFVDLLSGITKLGAKLIGFDGAYLRFEGTAMIEKIEDGVVVETVKEKAVWELMYFGKAGADKE